MKTRKEREAYEDTLICPLHGKPDRHNYWHRLACDNGIEACQWLLLYGERGSLFWYEFLAGIVTIVATIIVGITGLAEPWLGVGLIGVTVFLLTPFTNAYGRAALAAWVVMFIVAVLANGKWGWIAFLGVITGTLLPGTIGWIGELQPKHAAAIEQSRPSPIPIQDLREIGG